MFDVTPPSPSPGRRLADGGPDMIQVLTPEGERLDTAPPECLEIVDALTDDELRSFYRDLVLIRRFDAEATALQRQGELGLWASLLGQEAAQVGSGRALRPQDYAFPTYREHGVAWCRGVDPVNLMGMFRGVNHGGWDPNEKQTRAPLYHRARGFGFPGLRVDGNDVLAVYAATRLALDAARSGQGPSFIEAFTYRMGAHTTSDDPTKYRMSAEVEVWKLRDPIERLKAWLAHQGKADGAYFAQIAREADELGADVRARCLALPDPAGTDMFAHVYGEAHPVMAREEAEFTAYQASFEGAH